MKLNQRFLVNIRDVYGQEGHAWLQNLPTIIRNLSSKWNFRFLKPMENLSYNFVGLVEMKNPDQTAILKVAPKAGKLEQEIKYLECIKKGVAKVYQYDESRDAYLMEHIKPGELLNNVIKTTSDDFATRVICQIIRNLHNNQCHDQGFKHISEFAPSFSALKEDLDPKLLSKTQRLFQELTSNHTNDVLLHGDLHHANILQSVDRWKAIDPHGYIGDPAAEVGDMVRCFTECVSNTIPLEKLVERRLKILAEELPFDRQRIKGWAYCMTIRSLIWRFDNYEVISKFNLKVANIIDQIKL